MTKNQLQKTENNECPPPKRNPADQPLLAAWTGTPIEALLRAAGEKIATGCLKIHNRAIAIFYGQLLTGFWWEIGKGSAAANPKQKKASGGGKASPTKDLYLSYKAAYPLLAANRTLNGWGEAVLLGLQDEGWLALPARTGRKKQPRPQAVEQYKSITDRKIRALAKKYKNLSQLRQVLRERAVAKPATARKSSEREPLAVVLAATLTAITTGQVTADCLPLFEELQIAIENAVQKSATPVHKSFSEQNKKA